MLRCFDWVGEGVLMGDGLDTKCVGASLGVLVIHIF